MVSDPGETVFADTPLASYLNDVGVGDWGIEDNSESSSESETVDDAGLRPLVLDSTSRATQIARFKGLLRGALRAWLEPPETNKFVEQFRYILVSSPLLAARPLYSTYSATSDTRRRSLLFAPAPRRASSPAALVPALEQGIHALKLREAHALRLGRLKLDKVSKGGAVLAVAVLLAWKLKVAGLDISKLSLAFAGSQNSSIDKLTMVLALLVCLYLYAHSRRRLLRQLHAKSLAQVNALVNAASVFDGDVVRALKAIRQSGQLSNQGIMLTSLRGVLAASLHLAIEACLDAIRDLCSLTNWDEMQQYMAVYELKQDMETLGFTLLPNGEACFQCQSDLLTSALPTLARLKFGFKRLHFIRRLFLCCLLAVNANNAAILPELECWTVVADHCENISGLLHQLSLSIDEEKHHFNVPPVPSQSLSTSNELLQLNMMAQTLAGRIELLNTAVLDPEEYSEQAEAIDRELSRLNSAWHRLDTPKLVRTLPISEMGLETPKTPEDFQESQKEQQDYLNKQQRPYSQSTLVSSPSISRNCWRDSMCSDTTAAGDTPLFETMTEESWKPRVSRQERAERAERAKESHVRVASATGCDGFLAELNSVLERRNI